MSISLIRSLFAIVFAASLMAQTTNVGRKSILGFAEENVPVQTALETKFDSYLNATEMLSWLKRLSARPHHLGSPYNKENADFIASQFRAWGYDTKLEEFRVLFPTPKTRIVEMT